MIAGAGFARMAWALAKHRFPIGNLVDCGPATRRTLVRAEPWDISASREYYRIIDKAATESALVRRYASEHTMRIVL